MANNDQFNVQINISANISNFQANVKNLIEGTHNLKEELSSLQDFSIASSVVDTFWDFSKSILTSGMNIEATRVSFEKLTGSLERGNELLNELNRFAVTTPFDIKGTQNAARQILAFGYSVEEVIPMLRTLGDAAASVGKTGSEGAEIVRRLALQFGQMKAQGVAYAGNLKAIASTGIPVYEILAQKLSELEGQTVTVGDVFDRARKRILDAGTVTSILFDELSTRYGGMMEKLNEDTLAGTLENLSEAMELVSMTAGESIIQSANLKEHFRALTDEVSAMSTRITEGETVIEAFKNQFPNLASVALVASAVIGTLITASAITMVNQYIDTLNRLMLNFNAAGRAAGSVLNTIGLMVNKFVTAKTATEGLSASFGVLGSSISKTSSAFLAAYGPGIAFVGVITALALAIYGINEKIDEVNDSLTEQSNAFKKASESGQTYSNEIVAANEKVAKSAAATRSELVELSDQMAIMTQAIRGGEQTVKNLSDGLRDLAINTDEASASTDVYSDSVTTTEGALEELKKTANLTESQMDELDSTIQGIKDDFLNGRLSILEYNKALSKAIELLKTFVNAKDEASTDVGDFKSLDQASQKKYEDTVKPAEPTDTKETNAPDSKPGKTTKSTQADEATITANINKELQKTAELQAQIAAESSATSQFYDAAIEGYASITGAAGEYYRTILEGEKAAATLQESTNQAKQEHYAKMMSLEEQMANAQNISNEELKNATLGRIQAEMDLENTRYQKSLANIAAESAAKQYAGVVAQKNMEYLGSIEKAVFEEEQSYNANKLASQQEFYANAIAYETEIQELKALGNEEEAAAKQAAWETYLENYALEQEMEAVKHETELQRLQEIQEAQNMLNQLGQQAIQNTISGIGNAIIQGKSLSDVFKSVWQTALSGLISYYAQKIAKMALEKKEQAVSQKAMQKEWLATAKVQAQAATAAYIAAFPFSAGAAAALVASQMQTASAAVVPALAKGGYVSAPTLALVGEGNYDEVVTPLNRKTMSTLADSITAQMGPGAGGGVNVTINIGDVNTQVDYNNMMETIYENIYQAVSTENL